MYSANPSYENLRSSKFYQSSVNPNLSTTNLHQLNLKHFSAASSTSSLFEPIPKKSQQSNQYSPEGSPISSPITPPASISNTPIKEQFRLLDDDSLASVAEETVNHRRIIILCVNWYLSSIVSNYSTKLILLSYRYPVTLTQFQFVLNCIFSLVMLATLLKNPGYAKSFPTGTLPSFKNLSLCSFVRPNEFILRTTVPMGMFQFVGHITSHNATSIIPVSLNHTIKALSPITTVLIYRLVFKTKYDMVTYLTLIPLMVGIMLSCYKTKPSKPSAIPTTGSNDNYLFGLFYSFVSMLIFVSQNIFAKKRLTLNKTNILPKANEQQEKKLDKLSILYYCSLVGFIFTLPIYFILEYKNDTLSLLDLSSYTLSLIIINGASHFIQSLLAFQILGLISPINYSIANILKRIIIILVAFIIEGKSLSFNQTVGIVLTFIGLITYDRYGLKKHK